MAPSRRGGVRAERTPAERDEPTVADRTASADAQGYATDALRLAALRRDAALTATAETPRTHTAVDDNLIAGRSPNGLGLPECAGVAARCRAVKRALSSFLLLLAHRGAVRVG